MKIIECPRDAMQGLIDFIPTSQKAAYINQLLKVGFDTIDFGSFVSPKAIPQLRDTVDVLEQLDLANTKTNLLAIVANVRGATEAVNFNEITFLGYPLSVSETFQLRNTNATIAQSLVNVDEIQNLCIKNNKKLVVYLSMGFGNPYGDVWNTDLVANYTQQLVEKDVKIISLADTVGIAATDDISNLFKNLTATYTQTEFGAHLHTNNNNWQLKVDAAFKNGCKRFDTALKGYGGCPFANDTLTGNLATENLLFYLKNSGVETNVNTNEFDEALAHANQVFSNAH
ncbi:MAG: hydroxymethylglutaryl-CoA lyase [Bacteroidia bacterium]|nr:hydroxymethylglutaryl-CoA lyase [Bacteroidia bacterium]